jgi:hypothetical protein
MQQFTLDHANTFFFITTIAVGVLILILCVLLYLSYKLFVFAKKNMLRVDTILDNVTEESKHNATYKKVLPVVLPILSYFFSKKIKSAIHKKKV